MRAFVLAGGAGSRLRPLTDRRPKPLVPFCGEPFLVGLLRRLSTVCRHITLLAGADPSPFERLAGPTGQLGLRVDVLAEHEPLDTAGAVRALLAADPGDGPVLVCNGDVLTDLDLTALVAAHERGGAVATLALVRVADPSPYGVVVTDSDGHVERFVEKPAPGAEPADTINAGIYVLDPAALDLFPGAGPLSFEREVFPGLLAEGATLHGHLAEAHWADIGTPARYLDGTAAVLDGRCAWPLDPALRATDSGALVHPAARIAPDADVGAGSVVASGARVGSRARLRQAVLLDDAEVGERAHLDRVIVEVGAQVAAGAQPTPDSVIADEASGTAG